LAPASCRASTRACSAARRATLCSLHRRVRPNPFREGRTAGGQVLGRDHYPDCYTVWIAGGGVKAGHVHGSTDDLGFKVASDPVHVHDLQATLLHLLGFDHTKLTWRFQGRDFRLTDVHGHVVREILA
jgi:hypothetical protein